MNQERVIGFSFRFQNLNLFVYHFCRLAAGDLMSTSSSLTLSFLMVVTLFKSKSFISFSRKK